MLLLLPHAIDLFQRAGTFGFGYQVRLFSKLCGQLT